MRRSVPPVKYDRAVAGVARRPDAAAAADLAGALTVDVVGLSIGLGFLLMRTTQA
jgi:hypothetical protein